MTDLDELRADASPEVLRLIRVLSQVAEALRRHEMRLDALYERLMLVEVLPESAPFGALIRLTQGTLAQRAPLYLGNGPNQPLTKITPTQL